MTEKSSTLLRRSGLRSAALLFTLLTACATARLVPQAPEALHGLKVSVTCSSPASWREPFAEKEVCDATQDALVASGFEPALDAGKADLALAILVSYHGDRAESTVAHLKEPAIDVARFDRDTCGSMATGGPTARCLAVAIVSDLVESRRVLSWTASRGLKARPAAAHESGQHALTAQGRLAVLELRSKLKGRDAEAIDTAYFADLARGAALRTVPSLQVITRENLLVLLQAQGKTADACEGECEVETGRLVGADYVVSGDALRVGAQFKIDFKLHETKTARLLGQGVASGRSAEELDADTQRTIAALLGALQ
jgi:TolB-like protein